MRIHFYPTGKAIPILRSERSLEYSCVVSIGGDDIYENYFKQASLDNKLHRLLCFYSENEIFHQDFSEEIHKENIEKFISQFNWLKNKCKNENKNLLIHCQKGNTKAATLAYICHAIILGKGKESSALKETISFSRDIDFDLNTVGIADDCLKLDGRLLFFAEKYSKIPIKNNFIDRRRIIA
jgi:predicted protein tyrosine phosphatase